MMPVGQFWRNTSDSVLSRMHPRLREINLDFQIPIGVYGDAGSYNKQESVFMFTWNSLVASGRRACKIFLFTVIRSSQFAAGTMDDTLRVFVYSINACLESCFTPLDIYGCNMPDYHRGLLAGGFRGGPAGNPRGLGVHGPGV